MESSSWLDDKLAAFKEQDAGLEPRDATELARKLNTEGTDAYRSDDFEKALDCYLRHVALVDAEKLTETKFDRAGYISNCGACLHQLGHDGLARQYYTEAKQTFESEKPMSWPKLGKFFYGNLNELRAEFIAARLVMLEAGEKYDTTRYLDGSGTVRKWEKPAEVYPLSSYVSYSSWKRWYKLET